MQISISAVKRNIGRRVPQGVLADLITRLADGPRLSVTERGPRMAEVRDEIAPASFRKSMDGRRARLAMELRARTDGRRQRAGDVRRSRAASSRCHLGCVRRSGRLRPRLAELS